MCAIYSCLTLLKVIYGILVGAPCEMYWKMYTLISLTKSLLYEEREQLDSSGGGVLSQGAGHDGTFF